MPTSSITKYFIIFGQEQVETFVYAIEATVNYITHRVSINVTDLQETENIFKFMENMLNIYIGQKEK